MSKNVKAAAKLREAMSGFRQAMIKASSPSEKKEIAASMAEVRSIYTSLLAADEAPAELDEDELAEELDLPVSSMEDLGFADDEDEVLARSALALAASALSSLDTKPVVKRALTDEQLALRALNIAARALKAAEGEEEAAESEEEASDDSGEEGEEASSDEADDLDSDPSMDEMVEEPMGEGSEPSLDAPAGDDDLAAMEQDLSDPALDGMDDVLGDEGLPSPSDLAEPMPESDSAESDFDSPVGDEPESSQESAELGEEDASAVLTEEDLIALEQEGLLSPEEEAPAEPSIAARIKAVADRVQRLSASRPRTTLASDQERAVPFVETESPENLTFSEYASLMASYSPQERQELLRDGDSVVSARRMSSADIKKMERAEVKNRRLRKKRGPVLRSKTGKKASVSLPGGKRKTIKKKFYFTTFDAKGNKLGQHWMATKRPSKETIDAYKKKNGVPHPFSLPIDSKAAKAARSKPR